LGNYRHVQFATHGYLDTVRRDIPHVDGIMDSIREFLGKGR
jgi:hypothetical protein